MRSSRRPTKPPHRRSLPDGSCRGSGRSCLSTPRVRLAIVAANAAGGAARASDLAPLVGLGARQLQRRFVRATGLTIKTYSRIRRLRRTLNHLLAGEPRTWSQVAATLGFADHSHLAGEFARLAGAAPTEIAAYVAGIRHVDVVP